MSLSSILSAPKGLRRSLRTSGYYLIITLIGLIAAILGPAIPGFAESTRTTIGMLGSLFTIRSLGGLFGSYVSGRLYDRLPGHTMLALTLVGLSGSIAAVPFIQSLWLLWIFVFLWGLGESFLDVGVNTLLVWTYRERAAPYLNGLHFFFGVGALLAPLLYVQSIQQTGAYSWAFWVLAGAMLPVAAWISVLPAPNNQTAIEEETAAQFTLPAFLTCLIFFLYVGAEVSYGGWVYTYATVQDLASTITAGYLNSVFWGMLTLGRLLAIPAAVYFRPSRILLAALAGCLLSVTLLLLFPVNRTILWIATIGLGFSMAPIFPTLLAMAGRRMGLTGEVTGWFFIASNAGAMSIPWLSGLLLQNAGPRFLIPLLLADLLLALLVFGWLLRILPATKSESD